MYADYLGQIYRNKAKTEGNSLSIAEICNAEVVNLDIKMRAHELLIPTLIQNGIFIAKEFMPNLSKNVLFCVGIGIRCALKP